MVFRELTESTTYEDNFVWNWLSDTNNTENWIKLKKFGQTTELLLSLYKFSNVLDFLHWDVWLANII